MKTSRCNGRRFAESSWKIERCQVGAVVETAGDSCRRFAESSWKIERCQRTAATETLADVLGVLSESSRKSQCSQGCTVHEAFEEACGLGKINEHCHRHVYGLLAASFVEICGRRISRCRRYLLDKRWHVSQLCAFWHGNAFCCNRSLKRCMRILDFLDILN